MPFAANQKGVKTLSMVNRKDKSMVNREGNLVYPEGNG